MALRRTLPLLILALLPCFAHAACAGLSYRQFDFWLGDWNVTGSDGKLVGRDHIEKAYGDCALQEHWTSVDGGTGGSFTMYDFTRKVWHQTWVDSTGTLLVLEGGLSGGRMLMQGDSVLPGGGHAANRMSWTPMGMKLRQLWEVSEDGGKTWKVVFDVTYSKAN